MRWIVRRLYRERRRALLVWVLAVLAGLMLFGQIDQPGWSLRLTLIGALALAAVVTATLIALALFMPPLRAAAEVLAAMLLAAVWLGYIAPPLPGATEAQLASHRAGTAPPPLLFWLVWLIGYELYAARDLLDRLLPSRRVVFRSRATSPLPPEALFPGLALTPDTAARRGDPRLIGLDWIEPGRVQRLEYRFNDIATIEEEQTIELHEPGRRFRVRFAAPKAAAQALGSSGVLAYRLRPGRRGTVVQGERVYDRAGLRGWLYGWIDDSYGRFDDGYIDGIERVATLPPAG